ncbi:hypothetical protein SGLAM104S_03405 [Streptomyces glaucescens]
MRGRSRCSRRTGAWRRSSHAAVLLVDAGQEAGDVDQGDQGDVEGVAGLHEACGLLGAVDVEDAGEGGGLVGDQAHDLAVQPGQRAHHVAGPGLVDLEVVAVVDDLLDHPAHVVGLLGVGRDQRRQCLGAAVGGVVGPDGGGQFAVVLGEQREQVADVGQAFGLVVVGEAGDAGEGGVHVGAAEAVVGDLLAGDGLDDVRARDEHLGGAAHHEHEVGQRGGVGGAARARAEDDADLRDDAGGAGVAAEDAGLLQAGRVRFGGGVVAGAQGEVQPAVAQGVVGVGGGVGRGRGGCGRGQGEGGGEEDGSAAEGGAGGPGCAFGRHAHAVAGERARGNRPDPAPYGKAPVSRIGAAAAGTVRARLRGPGPGGSASRGRRPRHADG